MTLIVKIPTAFGKHAAPPSARGHCRLPNPPGRCAHSLNQLAFACSVIYSAVLFCFGCPYPNIDDLFYIGAALNVAQTGVFANPLLRDWSPVAAERYFFHFPLYARVLGGWVHIAGISSASLLLFQHMLYIIAAFCIYRTLRKYDFSFLASLATALAAQTWLTGFGLRSEALGLALTSVGLLLLTHRRPASCCLALIFVGCALQANHVMLAFVPHVVTQIAHHAATEATSRSRRSYASALTAVISLAAAVVLLVFLASIEFQVRAFVGDYMWHARFVGVGSVNHTLASFVHEFDSGYLLYTQAPVQIVCAILLVSAVAGIVRISRPCKIVVASSLVGLLLLSVCYASSAHEVEGLFVWGLSILILSQIEAPMPRRLCAVVFVLALAAQWATSIVALVLQVPADPFKYVSIRERVQAHADSIFAIDETSARYVFDYHLPESALNWTCLNSSGPSWPTTVKQKKPGETWIISPLKKGFCSDLPEYERARAWGHRFGSIPRVRFDVLVIDGS